MKIKERWMLHFWWGWVDKHGCEWPTFMIKRFGDGRPFGWSLWLRSGYAVEFMFRDRVPCESCSST